MINDALNLFFSFSGRIGRARLWLGLATLLIVSAVFFFAAAGPIEDLGARIQAYYTGADFTFAGSDIVFAIWFVAAWYVFAALTVKRLHDRDKSIWWAFFFVPLPLLVYFGGMILDPPANTTVPTLRLGDVVSFLVTVWWVIEMGALKGTVGANRFGPDPSGAVADTALVTQPVRPGDIGAFIFRGLDWKALIVLGVLLIAAIIVPSFANSPDSPFHLASSSTILYGKFLCYALLALSVGLIWGYGGILSLGHAAFFSLGGYAMGMYLMRAIGSRGVYGNPVLPDFMVFLNWDALPSFWYGFNNFWFAALMIVLAPGLLAFLFGWFAFRSRVTGVYLSIITQALTFALWQAFLLNDFGFGGNNGFTDFKDILGANVQSPTTRAMLFAASAIALAIGYWICRSVIASKYGRVLVATRDAESRTRFLGYRADRYKLFIFTLSACMAGVAGALYVPQAGIINPSELAPIKSIEVVVWVAVGGRGTLVGPIIGGLLINAIKSYFTGGAMMPAWILAMVPAIGLALMAFIRRNDGLLQSPLLGAAVGAAAAALLFVLPDSLEGWWGWAVAGVAALVWLFTAVRSAGSGNMVAGGAILGALTLVALRDPGSSLALAQYWLFALGGIFVGVTLFLPRGIVGTIGYGWNAWRARRELVEAEEGRDVELTSPEAPPRLPEGEAPNDAEQSAMAEMPGLGDANGKHA